LFASLVFFRAPLNQDKPFKFNPWTTTLPMTKRVPTSLRQHVPGFHNAKDFRSL
jgi:hypothetical protein